MRVPAGPTDWSWRTRTRRPRGKSAVDSDVVALWEVTPSTPDHASTSGPTMCPTGSTLQITRRCPLPCGTCLRTIRTTRRPVDSLRDSLWAAPTRRGRSAVGHHDTHINDSIFHVSIERVPRTSVGRRSDLDRLQQHL